MNKKIAAVEQLQKVLNQLRKEIKFSIEIITPEIAQTMLKTSKGNRNIKQDTLRGLVAEILGGKWAVNGETIVLDEENSLLDGHHRLEAIVKSNTAVICIIVSGIRRDTWTTMDSGCARSLGDAFKIEGIPSYSIVSTGVAGVLAKMAIDTNGIHTLGSGNMLKRSGNSRKDAMNFYYTNAEVFQTMAGLSQKVYKKLPCFRTKEVIVLSCYLIIAKKHEINQVLEFWNLVINGGDMFATMRSVFMNDAQETRYKKMSSDCRHSYIATIWNYYIQKHYVKKVRYNLGEHVDFI